MPPRSADRSGIRRRRALIAWMLAAVALVSVLALWDERRESDAALEDFAREQVALATGIATDLGTRLDGIERDAWLVDDGSELARATSRALLKGYTHIATTSLVATTPSVRVQSAQATFTVERPNGIDVALTLPIASLLRGATKIEHPGAVAVLLLPPDAPTLETTDGRSVSQERVRAALESGQSSLWLSRGEAGELGLPQRMAAVGLARVAAGTLGRWGVAVASTAEHVRDRERRAQWRLALGVALAAGLVTLFGSLALRNQRRELLLERELAMADLQLERDTRLMSTARGATLATLAMGIAHEVSTPLGIIRGRAEQLEQRLAGDDRAGRYVEAILEQSDRIRRTIRGFLDLARGGAPVLRQVDPALVVRAAVSLVEHRFAASGVALGLDIEPDVGEVRADVPMLEHAIVNLLLNACDACSRGGHVIASVRRHGERVTIAVQDDGVGIAPEVAARALEPFFTTKAPGKGTGLGLAISNEIVKLHRGELSIGRAPTIGTRVAIELPLHVEGAPRGHGAYDA